VGDLASFELLLDGISKDERRKDPNGRVVAAAASKGRIDMLDLLRLRGYNMNAERNGQSPLIAAISREEEDTAAWLLAHGADPKLSFKEGWTPLHAATKAGSVKTLELLLAHGAAVNAKDKDGMTPLMLAAKRGDPACAGILLRYGADRKLKNVRERTAFAIAAPSRCNGLEDLLKPKED
jgi:ankyrin repeat protein